MYLQNSSKKQTSHSVISFDQRDNSINLKEGKPLVRHTYILELSLLFSKSETAKMTIRENKFVIGLRPVRGV